MPRRRANNSRGGAFFSDIPAATSARPVKKTPTQGAKTT
jgi:hypothetical protein